MAWLKIQSFSSFPIMDRACPVTKTLLDSGMHVPLLVRFPQKWQHLAPLQPGEKVELVSFVDFGPTVLDLTDTSIPPSYRKTISRNQYFNKRNMFMDIGTGWMKLGFCPFSQDEKYLYIRNYMPHLGYNQPTAWPDIGEIRHEFYKFAKSGKMTPSNPILPGPDAQSRNSTIARMIHST